MAARTDRENDLAPPSKVREYLSLAKWDWRGTYSQGADETRRSNAKAKTTIYVKSLRNTYTRPFKTGNPTGITFKPLLTYHPAPLKNGACMRPRPYVGGSNDVGWKPDTSLDWHGRGGGEETRTHSVDSSIVYALSDPCFRVEMKDPSFGC